MGNCLVYYDNHRATSWIGDVAGEVLASELEKGGFEKVNVDKLKSTLEETIKKNDAKGYVVIFARDVVPHDVFDIVNENNPFTIPPNIIPNNITLKIPNIIKSPGNSRLIKFIYNGGTVVWLGDIPFWYVTNPRNAEDRLDLWSHNAVNPFTMLGTIQILTYPNTSPQPAISMLEDLELGVYPSNRPVLYPQNYIKYIQKTKDITKEIVSTCDGKLIPLTRTFVVTGILNPWHLSLPNGQIIDMFEILNRVTKVTVVESTAKKGKVELGIPKIVSGTYDRGMENQVIAETIPSKVPVYFETYSSWIRCIGKGLFIRLFDYEIKLDMDGNATVTEEEVKNMARKIRKLLEKLSKCKGN